MIQKCPVFSPANSTLIFSQGMHAVIPTGVEEALTFSALCVVRTDN
jgi:hypothetical protein